MRIVIVEIVYKYDSELLLLAYNKHIVEIYSLGIHIYGSSVIPIEESQHSTNYASESQM